MTHMLALRAVEEVAAHGAVVGVDGDGEGGIDGEGRHRHQHLTAATVGQLQPVVEQQRHPLAGRVATHARKDTVATEERGGDVVQRQRAAVHVVGLVLHRHTVEPHRGTRVVGDGEVEAAGEVAEVHRAVAGVVGCHRHVDDLMAAAVDSILVSLRQREGPHAGLLLDDGGGIDGRGAAGDAVATDVEIAVAVEGDSGQGAVAESYPVTVLPGGIHAVDHGLRARGEGFGADAEHAVGQGLGQLFLAGSQQEDYQNQSANQQALTGGGI